MRVVRVARVVRVVVRVVARVEGAAQVVERAAQVVVRTAKEQCLTFTGKVAVITTVLIKLGCGMVKLFVVW